VRNPQVFLFDEPLSNLDAKLRVQMRTEIKELHQRLKTTSIYVTHDQIEAMTMADKIVVLKDGIVEQIGSPLELYDRPANTFVAGFIGSPAMNFLPGHVQARWRQRRGVRRRHPGAGAGPRGGARKGQKVLYGIRPEHFRTGESGRPARATSSSSSRPARTRRCSVASPGRRSWRCSATA
jgi:multiple sugar transport system ATP-binding protein